MITPRPQAAREAAYNRGAGLAPSMGTRRRARGLPSAPPPAWLHALVACFLLYFVMIVAADVRGREALGLLVDFTEGRALVAGIVDDSAAARAGARVGDTILRVADRPAASRLAWSGVEANLPVGARVTFDVERNGQPLRLESPHPLASQWQPRTRRTAALWVSRLVQLACLALAIVVAYKRPRDRTAVLAAWTLASLGVYSVVLPAGVATIWRALPAPVSWVLWMPYASGMALAAVFFVFCSEFPQPLLRRRTLLVSLLPAAVGAAWLCIFGVLVVHGEARRSIGLDLSPLLLANWTAYFGGGLVLLWKQYGRLDDLAERRRLSLLLAGAAIGCSAGTFVAFQFWVVSPPQLTRSLFNSPVTMAGMLLVLAFPLSAAYVVSRHRVFDLPFLVRRGVQYALARRLLVSLVPALLAIVAFDLALHHEAPVGELVRSRLALYIGGAAALVLSLMYRQQWLDALDQRFFRDRYHAEQVLRNVAAKLRMATDPASAVTSVVHEIALALRPRFVAALATQPPHDTLVPVAATPGYEPIALRRDGTLIRLARVVGSLELSPDHDSWIAQHLPPTEAAMVVDAHVELIVPVVLDEQREAVFVLGPRQSEEPYARIDIDLLEAIAASLGLVLDRTAATATVPTSEADDVFLSECPSCAACFDTGRARCPHDGALLVATEVPPVLAGRYRIEARIGAGGMGTVYAAHDQALDRAIAIKVIGDGLVGSANAAERFRREAHAAASFTHPNVVTVHDVGVTRTGRPFLVMERLEGRTLRAELTHERRLQADRVLHITGDICRVLDEAHARGLVHRDLKPENVFLARATGVELTKVLDFGLATMLSAAHAGGGRSGVIVGSLPYMSPEQLRGDVVSPRWDLWAVAVMAVEMLTGERAVGVSAPGVGLHGELLHGAAHDGVGAFARVALASDIAVRPQTSRELLDCLALAIGRR